MLFSLVYEIGDGPERSDKEDFPDAQAAKAFGRLSLRMKLAMNTAGGGSVSIGQIEGPGEGDVEWLGAYDMERGGDPVWSAED